jgi:hypothetical protein
MARDSRRVATNKISHPAHSAQPSLPTDWARSRELYANARGGNDPPQSPVRYQYRMAIKVLAKIASAAAFWHDLCGTSPR